MINKTHIPTYKKLIYQLIKVYEIENYEILSLMVYFFFFF